MILVVIKMPNLFIQLRNENPGMYPNRMGEKWTSQERSLLHQLLDKNIKVSLIAYIFERTENSIKIRKETYEKNKRSSNGLRNY
jgi:hypothetical protein